MSAPGTPARDPSYAVNSTGASAPASRSKTLASVILFPPVSPPGPALAGPLGSPDTAAAWSAPAHALVVEVEQPLAGVVPALEPPVGLAVVVAPELVPAVEGRGVERLV